MKLENKVAIVTGGAMGNGLGIVKVFLKYKAKAYTYSPIFSDFMNESSYCSTIMKIFPFS